MHSLPFTEVLGFVACQYMSKRLGIGSAEQSWSNVKTINNGKKVNIGGDPWIKGLFCIHLQSLRRLN